MESSFGSSYFSIAKSKPLTVNLGDSDFIDWISSLNPTLPSKYPSLSAESQVKLKTLFILNRQTNSAVDEALKNINRCEQEFLALHKKLSDQLEQLGLGDDDSSSSETLKAVELSAITLAKGKIGDGTEIGSAASLAADFLVQTNISRQKLGLKKEIMILKRKNERLKDSVSYYQRECKVASEEVASLQAGLKSSFDLTQNYCKVGKLHMTPSLSRVELHDIGISPATSKQAILDSYKAYRSQLSEITILEKKLKQYSGLPPNITEAVQVVNSAKTRLDSLSDELKSKLTSFHRKGF